MRSWARLRNMRALRPPGCRHGPRAAPREACWGNGHGSRLTLALSWEHLTPRGTEKCHTQAFVVYRSLSQGLRFPLVPPRAASSSRPLAQARRDARLRHFRGS